MRVISILSLILMAITIALWMRSLGWRDAYRFRQGKIDWEIVLFDGKICLDDEPTYGRMYASAMREADKIDGQANAEGVRERF